MLAPGVIIPFDGLANSIPAGFSRVIALNGRFIKAWSDELLIGSQGGSDAHSHTSPAHSHQMNAHTHSVALNTATRGTWGSEDCTDGDGGGADHNHGGSANAATLVGGALSDAITYQAAPSLPPFHEVIWIQSNKWNPIPPGALIYSDQETVAGLVFCNGENDAPDLRGLYLRGAAADQNAGVEGGSLHHEHDVSHTHTATPHHHTGTTPSSGSGNKDAGNSGIQVPVFPHTHSFTTQNRNLSGQPYSGLAGGAEEVEPEFVKLKIYKNVSAQKVIPSPGILAYWQGSLEEIPIGWELFEEVQTKYLKCADDNDEIGDEGGANTHSHAASNSHAHGSVSHDHPGGNTQPSTNTRITNVGGTSAIRQHSHQMTVAAQSVTWQDAQISANPSNNEPLHTVLAVIKMVFSAGGGAGVVPRFL